MCPVCGATIGRSEYNYHDCAAGMVLWKYPATAIKELRRLGVPVPDELGVDAYDDRLFILDHDRELNGDFLGLGDSPAILKALLEILVDGLGGPKMKTDPGRPIAEGGNRPDNPNVGQLVPRGTFKGEDHLILRTRQIREHFVDNKENLQKLRHALGEASPAPPKTGHDLRLQKLRHALGEASPAPPPPRPRIIDANRARPDQAMRNGSPSQREPLTIHSSQLVVGRLVRHGVYGEGKITLLQEIGITVQFNMPIGRVFYDWQLANILRNGNILDLH
jgi:hypothetical protein